MPSYFGFEAVGAMILNTGDPDSKEKGMVLFTDQDAHNSDEKGEQDQDASDNDDDVRLTSNLKTANEMPARQPKNDKEEQKQEETIGEGQQFFNNAERLEHLHKMQEKKFINFPCSSGLSGQVFTSGELKVCNEAEKETAFVDEIDN